jgi:hypothetical protein
MDTSVPPAKAEEAAAGLDAMLHAWLAGMMAALVPLAATTSTAICTTSSGCEFWDNDYHEYILYEVDTAKVDILIVPPVSPFATRDIVTIEKSVQAWEDGIQALAQPWFASGLQINHYTLGLDVPPADALSDPEIIIVSAEYNPVLLLGIGLQTPFSVCAQRGGEVGERSGHAHEGTSFYHTKCAVGGRTCVVLNTSFLFGGKNWMYDLNSHELGHCLGIGHVGDALDFDAKTVPLRDIMSYQFTPSQVHCVSTLNVRSLEGVFAEILGQPSSAALHPGQYKHMPVSQYAQVACANP